MTIRSRSRSDGWGGNSGYQLDDSQRQAYVQTSSIGRVCGEMRTEEEAGREVEAALAKRVDHLRPPPD